MSIGIYKITNLINNKLYIGSSNNIEKRKIAHFSLLKRNKHHSIYLQNSYNKYGKNAFKFEIIELCSKEDLFLKEQFYVDFYISYKPLYGYNEAAIIKSSKRYNPVYQYDINGNFVKKWESATLVATNFNRDITLVHRACKKEGALFENFQWSYENNKNKIINLFNVFCSYNLEGEFVGSYFSFKEAIESVNGIVNSSFKSNLIRACKDKMLFCNLQWRRYDNLQFSKSINKYKRGNVSKIIYQIDKETNQILNKFNSVTEAALYVGTTVFSISRVLSNSPKLSKYKTAKGYKWKLENNADSPEIIKYYK